MDFASLKKLVRQGENLKLEFKLKAKYPEKIVREAVAFANAQGGKLLIGVDDDRNIKGLKFANEDEFAMGEAFKKYCKPNLQYQLEKITLDSGRDVLIYNIPQSKKLHYVVENLETGWGRAYVRVEDKSLKASREMREILRGRKRNRDVKFNYGSKEQILMKYLDEHKDITVVEFARLAKIPKKVASRTLVLLVLAKVLQIRANAFQDDSFYALEEEEGY